MDNLDQQMNELNELKDLMNQLESFSSNEASRKSILKAFSLPFKKPEDEK